MFIPNSGRINVEQNLRARARARRSRKNIRRVEKGKWSPTPTGGRYNLGKEARFRYLTESESGGESLN